LLQLALSIDEWHGLYLTSIRGRRQLLSATY
jgi:hypothetical protein